MNVNITLSAPHQPFFPEPQFLIVDSLRLLDRSEGGFKAGNTEKLSHKKGSVIYL